MSGEVRRWATLPGPDNYYMPMAHPTGEYVLWDDYADLLARYEAVVGAGRNLIAWTASGNCVPIDLPFVFRERWGKIVADIHTLERATEPGSPT